MRCARAWNAETDGDSATTAYRHSGGSCAACLILAAATLGACDGHDANPPLPPPPEMLEMLPAVPTATRPSSETANGCHDVTVGEWAVEKPVPGQEPEPVPSAEPVPGTTNSSTEVPPRIEFGGPVEWDSSYTEIVVPKGALPSVHNDMRGLVVDDSLFLVFSTGFSGVRARLGRFGEGWTGTARWFVDVLPFQVNVRAMNLTPVSCDSPPPVSIDALRPAIPRSVELEGGQAITLWEPLPESVDTIRAGRLHVVGRTAGLFGATDSIAVRLRRRGGLVESITLWYPNADAHAAVLGRLRDRYGLSASASNPVTGLSVPRRGGASGETSVELRDWRR